MSYMKGGFVHRRHDDVRDPFTSLLKDVCHDEVKPHLQPLTGEVLISSANSYDEACLDSHLNQKVDTAFLSDENENKRHYNQRIIEVEHGSFSPLVFSPYGGNGREAERFPTELA
ncbi:unnamed protein product, partial [Porites evermanni]